MRSAIASLHSCRILIALDHFMPEAADLTTT